MGGLRRDGYGVRCGCFAATPDALRRESPATRAKQLAFALLRLKQSFASQKRTPGSIRALRPLS